MKKTLTPRQIEQRINAGKVGGKARVPKGFAKMDKDKLREISVLGGSISKRGPVK